jgi:7-dehydrocholesterol reductase
LILDEPSNHLDLEAMLWLTEHLKRFRNTVLMVSHDRDLLNDVCDHIVHIDDEKLVPYTCNYDFFEPTRAERLANDAAQQAKVHGLSDSMIVAVGIQLVYIGKFYWWETGYLRSLDIMHDRAGFYICWGCLVWVPAVYTSSTLYLVDHPNHLGLPLAIGIFVLGVVSVFINYLADAQRQRVRATDGKTKVWGKPPVIIVGHYKTTEGEAKTSLLLASGWWCIARHFHYVPEILGAFFWSLPALFGGVLAYFYVIFLTILLTDRAFRDDNRCAAKYGKDWELYRQKVRWKILPGIV